MLKVNEAKEYLTLTKKLVDKLYPKDHTDYKVYMDQINFLIDKIPLL